MLLEKKFHRGTSKFYSIITIDSYANIYPRGDLEIPFAKQWIVDRYRYFTDIFYGLFPLAQLTKIPVIIVVTLLKRPNIYGQRLAGRIITSPHLTVPRLPAGPPNKTFAKPAQMAIHSWVIL